MRSEISSDEIASRFGKIHRNVMRDIEKINSHDDSCISAMFKDSDYVNLQNKTFPCKVMGVNGFCLLTDSWGYSRGKSAIVKAEILSEFGESFVVAGSARTRLEDSFHYILKEFLCKNIIIRQFPVGHYKVDFYLPEHGIIIEYDEDHHFSKKAMALDSERETAVVNHFLVEHDDSVIIVRVRKGEEIKGLAVIAGQLALNSQNATAITKYAENP